MMFTLRDVEVEGRRLDVAVHEDRIVAMGAHLSTTGPEIDGDGAALLPGLHDHHLHLLALAARHASVDCSPTATPDASALADALRRDTHPDGWVRGVLYHESVAGDLDRHRLDQLVPDRPVRIQHQSGALWMLNTLAVDRVRGTLDHSIDVERDARGVPSGRLWRYDDRLRPALPPRRPDLGALGSRIRDLGITGVTDATPDLPAGSVALLSAAVRDRSLDLDVTLMGVKDEAPTGLRTGPFKILLRDHDLPSWGSLTSTIRDMHAQGRPVGVHCVTTESLLLTLSALEHVGPHPGDRIEHASLVPEEALDLLGGTGVNVVTQPDFLRSRGDEYLRAVDSCELSDLYRHASLLAAGIPTSAASDAPFGALDPWQVIRSASRRRTADGTMIGRQERVSAVDALSGYLSHPEDPGGSPRRVTVGARADLCLLNSPLVDALADPRATCVRGTVRRGNFRATT